MISSLFSSFFHYLQKKHAAYFSITLVLIGYLFFNFVDALFKVLVTEYTTIEIVFWSSLFTFMGMICICAFSDIRSVCKTNDMKWHILRGILTLGYVSCNIIAFKYLSLANFYAIVFLSPILCVLMGRLFFQDLINRPKGLALLMGFIGVLIVVRPSNIDFNIGVIAVFLSAIMHASSLVIIRKISKNDHQLLFHLIVSIVVLLGALAPYIYLTDHMIIPEPYHLSLFIGCGFLCAVAATLIAIGFQIAPSTSTVAPFHYMQIIGGVVIGYLIWGDIPTLSTLIGSAIIIISGLMVIYNEKPTRNKAMHKYPL